VTSRGAYSGQGPSFTPPSLDQWAQDSRNGVSILITRQLRVVSHAKPPGKGRELCRNTTGLMVIASLGQGASMRTLAVCVENTTQHHSAKSNLQLCPPHQGTATNCPGISLGIPFQIGTNAQTSSGHQKVGDLLRQEEAGGYDGGNLVGTSDTCAYLCITQGYKKQKIFSVKQKGFRDGPSYSTPQKSEETRGNAITQPRSHPNKKCRI